MEFRRRTKRLSGLPVAFYAVVLLFFVLMFSFNSRYYKASAQPKITAAEIPETPEPKKDSTETNEIYVPETEALPLDTLSANPEISVAKEENKAEPTSQTDPKSTQNEKNSTLVKAADSEAKEGTITKIGKDRILTAFIPGTMGKGGKLPSHNCKAKGQLVMFITVDKAGNVTSAGRSSGIKDVCNVTAAVIWTKKYVKAKKSKSISQGTYTIVF